MARKALGSVPVTLMTVVAAMIVTAAVLWPAAAYIIPETSTTGPDPVTIDDYQGSFTVDEDGQLTAVETLATTFPCCRHGIFRFFDVRDPTDGHARLIPEDIEVTLDGADVPVAYSWEHGRRYRVAKIGDPGRTLSEGRHVYEISYRIDGALFPSSAGASGESGSWSSDDDRSAFYWNVVAGGWQMDIGRSESRVTLPTPADDVRCVTGFDSAGACTVTGAGTDGITIRTGALAPRTPVTVRATQDLPTPSRRTLPWTVQYDGVLGQSLPLALLVGLVTLVGLVVGRLWEWRSREAPPGYPVMYAPPDGLGPVQTYYVMNERLPSHGLVASLLHAAERGLVKMTHVGGKDWSVESVGGDWSQVDPVTHEVGVKLGLAQPGASFRTDGSVSAGKDLKSARDSLASTTKAWARQQGLLVGNGAETLGRLLVVAAAALFLFLVFRRPNAMTLWALPFGGFFTGAVGLLRPGVGTRRTAAGRDAWSRSGGFYRLLSTPSAEDRFDFSADRDLYTAYIPYAVAFDCADEWARKYRVVTGQEPPTPTWYVGPTSHGFFGGGSDFSSFESSVSSSIGAYEASQSSSSSGGGGFSGGGGGGGGGGGSW